MEELRRLYTPRDGGSRVLDFGCGSANFVNEARDLGWTTVAADFAESGLRAARDSGHEVHMVDDHFWPWLATQQFDVIRMSHVIEHLYRPREELRLLMEALRPEGVLHVITPDPQGPVTLLARRHSNFFELVHVTLIPPRTLTSQARQIGASQVRIVPEPTTKDLWRSWQLSTGRARSYESAAEAPGSRFLALGLRLMSSAFARAGRSDRYHAFLVR
jgi:2-polyprenyl-3-methyl-5-hydroxy-6-metoxy-1,4-benzoquinol methylase